MSADADDIDYLVFGPPWSCVRCKGTGWREPIGPKSDGSYITSRPCPTCRGEGGEFRAMKEPAEDNEAMYVKTWGLP